MRLLSLILTTLLIGAGSITAQDQPSTSTGTALSVLSINTTSSPKANITPQAHSNNPSTARLYSIIVPGGGQFYNGETGKGLAFLGAAVLGYALFATNIPSTDFYYDPDYYYASYGYSYEKGNAALCYGGLALALGATVWSVIDAPKATQRHNERLGLVSVPLGDQRIWANIDQSIMPSGPAYSLRVGLSF